MILGRLSPISQDIALSTHQKKKDESGTTRARGQQHGAEPKSFRRVAVEPVDLSLIAVNSGLHRRLGEPSDRIVCENLKWTTDMYWMSA